jgi:hypothetical protein
MKFSLRITDLLIIAAVIVGDCCVGVVFEGESDNTTTINYDIKPAEGEKVGIILDQYNSNNNNDFCDESKCVSTGTGWLFHYTFTCYTDGGDQHPMMCADGYKPRIIENETIIYHPYNEKYIPYQYFTCCPPNLSSDTDVICHCSNSTSINGWEDPTNKTIVCDDINKPYRREMKTNMFGIESYTCCGSIINENDNDNFTINYLDEIECVPYYAKFYQPSFFHANSYGNVHPILCDEPENGFLFPRYDEYNKTNNYHDFECCKTGPDPPPFIQDSAFEITIYLQIAISAIAVISSTLLIIALLIPLLKTKSTQNTNNAGTGTGTSATTDSSPDTRRRPQRTVEPAYSSYNLHLVYLAIPDVMLNLYLLTMYGRYANQKLNPNFYGTIIYIFNGNFNGNFNGKSGTIFEGAFIIACSTANLVRMILLFHSAFLLLTSKYVESYSTNS